LVVEGAQEHRGHLRVLVPPGTGDQLGRRASAAARRLRRMGRALAGLLVTGQDPKRLRLLREVRRLQGHLLQVVRAAALAREDVPGWVQTAGVRADEWADELAAGDDPPPPSLYP